MNLDRGGRGSIKRNRESEERKKKLTTMSLKRLASFGGREAPIVTVVVAAAVAVAVAAEIKRVRASE